MTYGNRQLQDVFALPGSLRNHAEELGIGSNRIGLSACSGNVPMALAVLMREAPGTFRCAAFSYGLMLDFGGETIVADFFAQFGASNPCAGRSVGDLPADLPLLPVRAGQDQFPASADPSTVSLAALTRNLPMTLVNHAQGAYSVDIAEDCDASREVIRLILAFLRMHLV